jgi:excinuclease UvrABC nuclease subunit
MENNINGNFVGAEYLQGIDKGAEFVVDGVVIGLPFNLAQVVDRFGKEIIPNSLGIYHLFYHDQLVYIGMSKSIRGRLLQHLKDKDMPFNNCLWFVAHCWKEDATIEEVLGIEYRMIKKFKPVLNSMYANCR